MCLIYINFYKKAALAEVYSKIMRKIVFYRGLPLPSRRYRDVCDSEGFLDCYLRVKEECVEGEVSGESEWRVIERKREEEESKG